MGFYIVDRTLRKYKSEKGETEVVIPEGVTRISGSAFADRRHLTSVAIPEGVEFIGCNAFAGCANLRHISIPGTVKKIEFSAFAGTPWLEEQSGDFIVINDILYEYRGNDAIVTIPDSVRVIGDSAFPRFHCVQEVHLPAGLERIESWALSNCSGLRSVTIPEGVTFIGHAAFFNCHNLLEVSIPQSVEEIRASAFENTPWLEKVKGDLVILGNGVLYRYRGQDPVARLPEHVKYISPSAFYGCRSLTAVITPTAQGDITVYTRYDDFQEREWLLMMEIVREPDNAKQELLFADMKKACFKIPLALHMVRVYDSAFFRAYLKRQIRKAMETYICYNDTQNIMQILELGFVTARNIDSFIEQAIAEGSLESQIVMMHYKSETLGYKAADAQFKL